MSVTEEDRAFACRIAVTEELRNVILSGRFDNHPYVELAHEIRIAAFRAGMEHAAGIVEKVRPRPVAYDAVARMIRDEAGRQP